MRSLWALWFANFVTATGIMAMVPFLTFFVEELGIAEPEEQHRWAGILVGAAPLAAAFMGPVWGGIGDRFGRKAMVVRALCGAGLFVGLMGLSGSVWTALLFRTLQGVFSAFVPPSLTLASLLAPPGQTGYVTSRIQSAVPAGAVAGFYLGGELCDAHSVRLVFPICAGLAAIGALVVVFLVGEAGTDRTRATRRLGGVFGGLTADFRYLLGLPVLVRFLVVTVVARFAVSLVDPNFVRFAAGLGIDEDWAGGMLAAEAAAHLVFMPFWGRYSDRLGHRRTFALCSLGVAAAWFAQASATGFVSLAAFRLLNGVFLCGIVPAAYGLAARESAPDRRGSAMGAVFLCVGFAHALGSMAGGDLLNALDFRPLMRVVAGLLVLLAGLAFAESWRARRRSARPPP